MSHKVLMLPTPTQAEENTTNAINQIVLKLARYLPDYGYTLTENAEEADIIAGHAGQTYGQAKVLSVAHCHGLYPTALHGEIARDWAANVAVINNLKHARAITVPSQWVGDILRRDMHVQPDVVGWAIDLEDWNIPDSHHGYVLWNKTRESKVCDPRPLIELAAHFPQQQFVTTFGSGGPNVRTIGLQPYGHMREIVHGAEIYLATTKETFGIGTLEAMACGIPILGYRHGATPDLVKHGLNGFLAEPGDIESLCEGLLYCKTHREVLGRNARKIAAAYTWDVVARQFAAVYDRLLDVHTGPKVSVIIPLHNYGHWVADGIASVLRQVTKFPFEIIVVENGSTDNSYEVARAALEGQANAQVIQLDRGVGPAMARNLGIERAQGEYILCLDADDELAHPEFIQRLADALDEDINLGIAYTGLAQMRDTPDGERLYRVSPWPSGFNFESQCTGFNQVPTCCLFRKEAWKRAGGYRSYLEPAEDAELWLRITELGYAARQVIKDPWFYYRMHEKSLSHPVRIQMEKEPDWLRFHPWVKNGNFPFAAGGAPKKSSWPVRNYDRPLISVIVPCGPGHEKYLSDALDSIEGQTEWRWEAIVVNDTPNDFSLPGQPWARVIHTGGGHGPGYARNVGIKAATAPLIAFLDADDLWEPRFLELTLQAYHTSSRYVYTDWMTLNAAKQIGKHETPNYEPGIVFKQTSIHAISILIEKTALEAVGGFDEDMTAWEDVDLFMKLAAAGYCGHRVPQYLMYYRHQTGNVRERGETIKADLKDFLYQRYEAYMKGEKVCNCANNPKAKVVNTNGQQMTVEAASANGEMVRILYQGASGKHDVYGQSTRQYYGRRAKGDIFYVWPKDMAATPLLFVPVADINDIRQPAPVPEAPRMM